MSTLRFVDRVRFGRALGYGTRHLARTLTAAAEAAAAPAGGETARKGAAQAPGDDVAGARLPRRPVAVPQILPRSPASAAGAGARAQHLKRSFLQPLLVYSGALWLRVTGSFFALLALTMGGGAWRQRSALRASVSAGAGGSAHHFWVFAIFAALFGYFAVSSFVRAGLRERRGNDPR